MDEELSKARPEQLAGLAQIAGPMYGDEILVLMGEHLSFDLSRANNLRGMLTMLEADIERASGAIRLRLAQMQNRTEKTSQ
jgi:hypothetical protein